MADLLYLGLNIGAIFFPIVLSFDKKVYFFRHWIHVLAAIVAIGIPFLVWDYFFTEMGVWGFNGEFLTEYYLLNLPIEEVLFFAVVPFSCTFIYQCCKVYFSAANFTTFNLIFSGTLFLYILVTLVMGWGKGYSTAVALLALLLFVIDCRKGGYVYFPLAFSLSMIPFFLMNGVLTGAITDNPVVWYNEMEIIGWRYYTIPFEDVLYSYTLLFLNIVVYEWLEKKNGLLPRSD